MEKSLRQKIYDISMHALELRVPNLSWTTGNLLGGFSLKSNPNINWNILGVLNGMAAKMCQRLHPES
jgi:hypothetical protein